MMNLVTFLRDNTDNRMFLNKIRSTDESQCRFTELQRKIFILSLLSSNNVGVLWSLVLVAVIIVVVIASNYVLIFSTKINFSILLSNGLLKK